MKLTHIEPGDIVEISRGGIGVVVDVIPFDAESKDSPPDDDDGSRWRTLSHQRTYWKDTYGVDIGQPTELVVVVHLPGLPGDNRGFYYPDTTIRVHPTGYSRRYFGRIRWVLHDEYRSARHESRRAGCGICGKRIHWWQHVSYESSYDYDVFVHRDCQRKATVSPDTTKDAPDHAYDADRIKLRRMMRRSPP